jgi:hypothetical protein
LPSLSFLLDAPKRSDGGCGHQTAFTFNVKEDNRSNPVKPSQTQSNHFFTLTTTSNSASGHRHIPFDEQQSVVKFLCLRLAELGLLNILG